MSAVASRPHHAANAKGCTITVSVSGSDPNVNQTTALTMSGSPRISTFSCGPAGTTFDMWIPNHRNGSSATKPAIGPETPMSNSARFDGNASRIRITAPNVPERKIGGAGMKYGSVASTL